MIHHPDNPIADDVDDAMHSHKTRLFARLRKYFLTGVVVTAPITITIYVSWWLLKFIDTNVAKLIPPVYNPNNYLPFEIPGLGLVIAAIFFVLVGWFARNFLGRIIISWSEFVVERMPVVSTIYSAVKQVFETTMGDQSKAFREVVLFEYPRKGSWTVGFVTGIVKGEIQRLTEDEVVNVYIPTTPNPTSGFLLFLPRKDLIYISMTPEDAIKLIVSGGIISPPDRESKA